MNKQNIKISYDKDSRVLSINMKRAKSVDSDIHGNVVIDYDKQGNAVRVNFYDFNFNAFKAGRRALSGFATHHHRSLMSVR